MLRLARLLRRFADRIDPPEPKGYFVEPDWFFERVKAERDARSEIASTEGMSVKRDAGGHVVAVPPSR